MDPDPPSSIPEVEEHVLVIPPEPNARTKFLQHEGTEIIRNYGLRCKLQADGSRDPSRPSLTQKEVRDLILLLRALSNIDGLTTQMAKDIRLKLLLQIVLNRHENPRQKFSFPPEAVAVAQQAWDKYESEEWGASGDDEISEEFLPEDGNVEPGMARESNRRLSLQLPQETGGRRYIPPPPASHPIYGTEGIMRGILVDRGPKTTSYLFNDQILRPSYKKFGHNDLKVGDWWPMQICVLRDGAHGSRNGGIAGSVKDGAISIIASGGYKGMDKDRGTTLLYSGSDSHTNTNPREPRISANTSAMITSHSLQKPIRVIRSDRSDWEHAPTVGFRYDGLYRITQYGIQHNEKGGAYYRFKLQRLSRQPEMVFDRPNAKERRDFERVKDWY